MDDENASTIIVFVLLLILLFLIGIFVGEKIEYNKAYKQGQLDYQSGIIEWTMIDGKLHHIQGE